MITRHAKFSLSIASLVILLGAFGLLTALDKNRSGEVLGTATAYYVTQSGAGTHNGSIGNAWSVAEFNASSLPTQGDTVYFSGTISSTVGPATGGAAGNRLTLDFKNATLTTADPRINLNGQSYLNVYGGTFASSSDGTMIMSQDTPTRDITISGWTYTGNAFGTAQFAMIPQVSNVLLENNTVDNVMRFVINWRAAENITIRNNYARSTTAGEADDIQVDVVFLGDSRNVTIEGNKFINRSPGKGVNNHADVIQGFQSGAGGNQTPHGWIIRYNWIEIGVVGTSDGSNQWLCLQDFTSGMDALKMYGNVFVGDDSGATNGINVSFNIRPDARMYFYNNTVIRRNSPWSTWRLDSSQIDLRWRNNVTWAPVSLEGTVYFGAPVAVPPEEVEDWNYNFFYNASDCNATLTGANGSCSLNPSFVNTTNNNFALQSTSALIGKGTNLGSEYSMGLAPGATWPNPALISRGSGAWDPGAYVYSAVTVTQTPPPAPAPTPTPPPPAPEPAPAPLPPPPPPASAFDPGDITPPSIIISSPAQGATIPRSKTLRISGEASDPSGIAKVQFYVRGSLKCTDYYAPYGCSWYVPSARNKAYSIQAVGFDKAGNIKESEIITVISSP